VSAATPDPIADRPERWPVTGSEHLHRDGWVVALRRDQVHPPGGEPEEAFARLVLEHPGAVVVLAVDDEDRVLCLQQYRHAVGMAFVELPAGLLDAEGEEPLEVARRELREEAGLAATDWEHLGTTYPSPGISDEVQHLFLARGLSDVGRGDFVLEHEEAAMTVFWAPFTELVAAALDGRVSDGPVVQALLLAQARGLLPTSAASPATDPEPAE
jgi:8-oxo-dGDP phosphatase